MSNQSSKVCNCTKPCKCKNPRYLCPKRKGSKVWVLTVEVNAYDQYGGYFSGVFSSEKLARDSVDHIGRVDDEESWYELEEVLLNSFVIKDLIY